MREIRLLLFLLFLALAFLLLGDQILGQTGELGSLKVSKRAQVINGQGLVLTTLTVENNGSVPVLDLEVFEYFNIDFQLGKNVTLIKNSTVIEQPVKRAAGNQFIVPLAQSLQPGQKVTLQYLSSSFKTGDSQVPSSLVWFSYQYGASTVRTSIYSNALLVHIPNATEQFVIRATPYIVSVASGIITFIALNNLRRYLPRRSKSAS